MTVTGEEKVYAGGHDARKAKMNRGKNNWVRERTKKLGGFL
jgi:hypothetical protein